MTDGSPPVPAAGFADPTDRRADDTPAPPVVETRRRNAHELTPVVEHERSYVVLGSYDREQLDRLDLVVDRLNRREDAYAFRLRDLRGDWENGVRKFCRVADQVSHIVGVAENEPSGFLVEQGLLVGRGAFFEKTTLLKRRYPDTDRPYGWMEDGVFELLERAGRLHEWRTEPELIAATRKVPSATHDCNRGRSP